MIINNNCRLYISLLLAILALNLCYVKAIFIQLFNNTYAFEFKVSVTITNRNGNYVTNTDDYAQYYWIDNVCTELKKNDSSLLSLQATLFDVNTYIYGDFNHNLRFMLNIRFKSKASFINNYQVIITDAFHNATACIRIIERKRVENLDKYFKVERVFDLTIKDPQFVKRPNPQFNFYFGAISVRPLIPCTQGKYDLSDMCLIMSDLEKTIDAGIRKKPGGADIEEFAVSPYTYSGDECESDTLYGCTKIHFNNSIDRGGNSIYTNNLIYIHKMNPNVAEVTAQFGLYHKFHDNITSYQDEMINNLVFKIVKNANQLGATKFNHLLFNSKLSRNLSCTNSSYTCICDNKCAKCSVDVSTTYIKLKVRYYDTNCNYDIYSIIEFQSYTYKTTFLDYEINKTTELHLYESYPKLCYLTRYNEKLYDRNSNTPLRYMEIRLRDLKALTYNRNFDIKYQIRLYEFCESNITVVSNVLFEDEITDTAEPVLLSSLMLPGYYAIELRPIVNSNYCKESLCPFQQFSRRINSNKIVCEPCKKIVFFINLGEDEADMSDYKCLDSRRYLSLKSFENVFSYSSSENTLHVSQNNLLFNVDYSLIINDNVTVAFPNNLVNKYKCRKIDPKHMIKTKIPILIIYGKIVVSCLMILLVLALLFVMSIKKKSTPIKVLIILTKGLNELSRELDTLVTLVQSHLKKVEFQIIKLSDVVDIELLISQYESSNHILLVCNEQSEIENLHLFHKKVIIGQDLGDDGKYVLLSNPEFNKKLRLIKSYQTFRKFAHYKLPEGFSKFLETLIMDYFTSKHKSKGYKEKIESYLLKPYIWYIKMSINEEYKRIQKQSKFNEIALMIPEMEHVSL